MQTNKYGYGIDDSSYKAAGELAGISKLVDAFYHYMNTLPQARAIREMHPADISESSKKLAYFLSGWLGGPRLYSQFYGGINIPGFHRSFAIGAEERDAWLRCMQHAIADQPYADTFKSYLLAQLRFPAERIKQVNVGKLAQIRRTTP